MKYFSLIWGNLKRRKLRTILTLLSILVAFLLFAFLCAMTEAFTGGVSIAGADRLMVRHKVSIIQTLPVSYTNRIAAIPGVSGVTHQTWFGGIYQDPKENFFATMPVEPESFAKMYNEIVVPPDVMQAWLKTRNGAIVGKALMDRMAAKHGWKVGSRVPITSPIWGEPANQPAWEFEIVGVYDVNKKGADNTSFYFRYDYFDEAREKGKGEVGWYSVRVENPDNAAAIAKRIDEEFANSPYETKAETEAAAAQGFAQQVGDIGTIMVAVLSAVFFTILLVAGNTMSQAVRERTEELGVLKAMGFTNELVLVLVMVESCVLAALGGFTGLGLGWAIISATNPVPDLLPNFFLPEKYVVIGAAIVLALGIVAGAAPAIQAMRLRIAEALRRNG
ncbi:ABC transporter permease [Verrucomicrobium sp. BvORR106]|uniref:ABC transporter permease n=1 Tax=Verrucomicrobium sp. BvORR106 TaxID=1403819 RepID=UPI00056E5803|nr:ABC transporter permease [Verrucomicrobium sp. BvORR106]